MAANTVWYVTGKQKDGTFKILAEAFTKKAAEAVKAQIQARYPRATLRVEQD